MLKKETNDVDIILTSYSFYQNKEALHLPKQSFRNNHLLPFAPFPLQFVHSTHSFQQSQGAISSYHP